MIVQAGHTYRNKKNQKLYKVTGVARHSETLEFMVCYKALYATEKGYYEWVRPFDLFVEKFEEVNHDTV